MQAQGRSTGKHRTAAHLAALALYACLAAVLTYPLPRYFARAIPGDGFDGWQNYWNLWWMKIAPLVEHRSPYFSDIIYYPTGVDLHFHTLNPFNGLWTLPIQLDAGLMVAYNAVVLLSFVLGGYGAFLLALYAIRKAGLNGSGAVPAAFLGGVVYTFSPFHFAHLLGHMQVFSLEWLPFYALALWQTVDAAASSRRWARRGVLAAVFLTLIGLCNWYYLLYSAILTAILFLWMLFRRRMSAAVLGSFALATGGALVLLSPILLPMIRQALGYHFMVPNPAQSRTFSADLLAFFTPNEFHPLWGRAVRWWTESRYTASLSEHLVFAGYVPLALAALATVRLWTKSTVRLWAISLATFFVLALGPVLHVAGRTRLLPGGHEIPLPYALFYRLPFVRISRSVSRFDVMVMLSLAVLAALGVAFLLRKARGRWMWLLAGAAIVLTLFEFFPAPYPFSPPDTPAWYHTLAAEPGDFAILNLPISFDRPGYLLYQTVHGKRLTVAYISREDPRTLVERAPVLQEFRHLGPDVLSHGHDVVEEAPSVLRYLGVRYVVLDGYKMPAGEERKFTYGLAACIFADEKPVYEDNRLRVYRVPDDRKERPFLVLGLGWGKRETDGDRVWRVPPREASVIAVSARPAVVRLHLKARGTGGVTIAAPGLRWHAPLGNEVVTPEFAIPAGETKVTLSFDAPPQVEGVWLETSR